jgi:Uma2 family endonuclease
VKSQVIIEVLSDAPGYDRGRKFEYYRSLTSLQAYLRLLKMRRIVERHVRQPENAWLLTDFGELNQTVQIPGIGCDPPLAEIYRKIDWSA